ncbi:MAG: hypothetical protein ACUVXA_15565 [Candidatus Jordarchaeum sp.]|uniref:hypothetical protein n=1 Tax=Candidatus Jordarchaeum sp. TaxID=2823881 RepID=UPI0040499E40
MPYLVTRVLWVVPALFELLVRVSGVLLATQLIYQLVLRLLQYCFEEFFVQVGFVQASG